MNSKRVRSAAVGGGLILILAVAPEALGRTADVVPACAGYLRTFTETRGMTGIRDVAMMPGSEADYLAEMIPHHREAVAAAHGLARSSRPQMRELGASIMATQTAEIDEMQGWLRRWHPGTAPAEGYRPMMRDLSGLEGDALDTAFLKDMIRHHMMAVMMSQQMLRRDIFMHDDVAEFVASVRDRQRAEIGTMRGLLGELAGTSAGWSMRRYPIGGQMHR